MSDSTYDNDLKAFREGSNVFRSEPPPGMSQQDYDEMVMKYADSYRAPTYKLFSGPNSNSAAVYPIIRAGGSVPDTSWAPALKYWNFIFGSDTAHE
jgi:hypothetical protein